MSEQPPSVWQLRLDLNELSGKVGALEQDITTMRTTQRDAIGKVTDFEKRVITMELVRLDPEETAKARRVMDHWYEFADGYLENMKRMLEWWQLRHDEHRSLKLWARQRGADIALTAIVYIPLTIVITILLHKLLGT